MTSAILLQRIESEVVLISVKDARPLQKKARQRLPGFYRLLASSYPIAQVTPEALHAKDRPTSPYGDH